MAASLVVLSARAPTMRVALAAGGPALLAAESGMGGAIVPGFPIAPWPAFERAGKALEPRSEAGVVISSHGHNKRRKSRQ